MTNSTSLLLDAPDVWVRGAAMRYAAGMTIDPRVRTLTRPTRVLWHSDGDATPENIERLLNPIGNALVDPTPACKLRQRGTVPGVLLDFGREVHGHVQIITALSLQQRVRVRLRFGESASEAMGAPVNDHGMHDQVVELSYMSLSEHGPTGFRFVRIDLLDAGTELNLLGVQAVELMRPEPMLGAFACNDARVNAVWAVGARTVHLCMQEFVWDGIKRDRLAWIGDLHPEAMVIARLWGDHALVRATMDFVRDTTPLPAWMNTISSYSLWWLIILGDWHARFGDDAYLQAQRAYLVPLVQQVAALVDADGNQHLPGGLIDWATANDDATRAAGMHALTLWALRHATTLAERLGESATAALASSAAQRLIRHGAPKAGTKQAAALTVLTGLRDATEANATVLAPAPSAGLSPFYGYYVLEARARAGDITGGLALIREYWGAMVNLGATSLWEHFDMRWLKNAGRIDELPTAERVDVHHSIDVHRTYGEHCYIGWRHSLCHGWSAGPTAWLIDHVLGLQLIAPDTLRMAPNLGDLEWAEGALPTPHGVERVRHERRDGRVVTTRDIPAGLRVIEA